MFCSECLYSADLKVMLGLRLLVLYLGEQDETLFLESAQVIQISVTESLLIQCMLLTQYMCQ